MAKPPDQNDKNSDTIEFVTDEFEQAALGKQPVKRRRRRRRKSTKSTKSGELVRPIGIGLGCVMLVLLGVWLGLVYRTDPIDEERYRLALQTRQKMREQWLEECGERGYSEWTCNRFDRAHFEVAEQLDEFICENVEEQTYHCIYTLGNAQVIVAIPTAFRPDGEYRSPRVRSHAVISHSDHNDQVYIAVSENGHVEIREQNQDTPLFIINPSTGTLNAVQDALFPDDNE